MIAHDRSLISMHMCTLLAWGRAQVHRTPEQLFRATRPSNDDRATRAAADGGWSAALWRLTSYTASLHTAIFTLRRDCIADKRSALLQYYTRASTGALTMVSYPQERRSDQRVRVTAFSANTIQQLLQKIACMPTGYATRKVYCQAIQNKKGTCRDGNTRKNACDAMQCRHRKMQKMKDLI